MEIVAPLWEPSRNVDLLRVSVFRSILRGMYAVYLRISSIVCFLRGLEGGDVIVKRCDKRFRTVFVL